MLQALLETFTNAGEWRAVKKGSSRTFANIGQDVKKWIMSSSSLWHSKQVAGIGLEYWVNLCLSICKMNVAVIILAPKILGYK
jgi:hypothetical protein